MVIVGHHFLDLESVDVAFAAKEQLLTAKLLETASGARPHLGSRSLPDQLQSVQSWHAAAAVERLGPEVAVGGVLVAAAIDVAVLDLWIHAPNHHC
ncbi:hypothetical protein Mapa_008568 [Marchantia paleacea]|nr:hypothetical protein Mapa_008568 [Marchantia paleacea]